jgi:phage terminase small subunit
MKIAFADITDVMSFGYEVMPMFTKKGAPILNEDGSHATTKVNFVDFKNDHEVDGTVISEVKQGKEGISVKLHDKMRALKELEKYLNFMTEEDKLKIEKLRHEVRVLSKDDDNGNEPEDDGFMEALKGIAAEVWSDDGASED